MDLEERVDALEMRLVLLTQMLATVAGGLAGRGALGDTAMNATFAAIERYGHVSEQAYTESRALRGMVAEAMR